MTLALLAASAPLASGLNPIPERLNLTPPDLVVDQVYSIVSIPDGSDVARAYIYVEVINRGVGFSPEATLDWTMVDLASRATGQPAVLHAAGSAALPALAPGAWTIVEITPEAYMDQIQTPGALGRMHMVAVADGPGLVDESDEANNLGRADVFVGEARAPS